MGFWTQLGTAALTATYALGDGVIKAGTRAVKDGTQIYKDYQKNPDMPLAGRILDTTFSSLGDGIMAAASDVSAGASDIYADYQKTKREEAAAREAEERQRAEAARFKQEIAGSTYTAYSKIAGVTHEGRQARVQNLMPGQYLRAEREYHNRYDSHAVALYSGEGQVCYIKAELSPKVARLLDNGDTVNVRVEQITGGGDRVYGVNICLESSAPLDPPTARTTARRSSYSSGYNDYGSRSAYDDDDYCGYTAANSQRYASRDPDDWDDEDAFWEDVWEHEHD